MKRRQNSIKSVKSEENERFLLLFYALNLFGEMQKIKISRKPKNEWTFFDDLHIQFDQTNWYHFLCFRFFACFFFTHTYKYMRFDRCIPFQNERKTCNNKTRLILTCSMTSLSGFPTFCSTVSANENSGADGAGVSAFVDAADVAVSGVFVLSFLLFCSFSPCWPFGRTRNWLDKTTCTKQWK